MAIWETIEPLWSGAEQGTPSPTPNQDAAGQLYPPGEAPKPEAEKSATEKPEESKAPTPEAEKSETEAEKSAKVPEGDYEVRGLEKDQQVDKEALGIFQPVAKEIGLTQAQFDKLAPVYPKIVETIVKRQDADNATMIKSWEAEAREDKEIGGAKFDENIGLARTVIQQYGTPELRQILQDSGLGNHREIIRLLHRFGTKNVKEPDANVRGSSQPQLRPEEILYGKSAPR